MASYDGEEGVAQLFQSVSPKTADFIGKVVNAAKDQLDADIAFLSAFDGDRKVIRRTAGDGETVGLVEGRSFALQDTYCHRVVKGTLPNIIADARNDARVKELPITDELKIGAYVGVPITLPDGRVYGTLCCVSQRADTSLTRRDVKFMRVLADLVAGQLHLEEAAIEERRLKTARIRSLSQNHGFKVVFQPVVDLANGTIVGAEALSRFDVEPRRSPDLWFKEASEVGLGLELEMLAVRSAIAQIGGFPEGVYLSVNASPETFVSDLLAECIAELPPGRIVVELTEHVIVEEPERLLAAVRRMREKGARIAMDDVGAGYSGLSQILRFEPNVLKLDTTLTQDISRDHVRQALVSAAVQFAARVGTVVVAEGVETAQDMDTLRVLGIRYAQGYYFAKPGPLPLQVQTRLQRNE